MKYSFSKGFKKASLLGIVVSLISGISNDSEAFVRINNIEIPVYLIQGLLVSLIDFSRNFIKHADFKKNSRKKMP